MKYHKNNKVQEIKAYLVENIAAILNISRTSAYKFVHEGYFKIVRIGKTIRNI